MTEMVRRHHVVEQKCIHCGRVDPQDHNLCVPRWEPGPNQIRPEPSARTMAADDVDEIHRRLVELRGEREAAAAGSVGLVIETDGSFDYDVKGAAWVEVHRLAPGMDPGDCCA